MKVLQINYIYEKFSTGRTTKEMHEYFLEHNIESYVACRDITKNNSNFYKIGNKFDWKIHAFLSRILGLQGYFSILSTKKLTKYISKINPDIIVLRNLHSNYINLPILLKYISKKNIATVVVLHDCWLYTGKCMYYIDFNCNKWQNNCKKCPAKKKFNKSYFFDFSHKMYIDKKKLFKIIKKLSVVGVSNWVIEDAKKSLLQDAKIIKTIYNWIDIELFKPHNCVSLKKDLKIENKFIILGIAMNWSEAKGIKIFYELSNMLSDDCQIILVGNMYLNAYKNDKIKFLGTINDVKQLSDLYSAADVFVNPSLMETFGKTTAEALCSGTPVIAYNGTATPELLGLNSECGYLIDYNDVELYKEKILKIKAEGKDKYGKKARQRALQLFSYHKNMDEYIKLFEELINS